MSGHECMDHNVCIQRAFETDISRRERFIIIDLEEARLRAENGLVKGCCLQRCGMEERFVTGRSSAPVFSFKTFVMENAPENFFSSCIVYHMLSPFCRGGGGDVDGWGPLWSPAGRGNRSSWFLPPRRAALKAPTPIIIRPAPTVFLPCLQKPPNERHPQGVSLLLRIVADQPCRRVGFERGVYHVVGF